MVLFCFCLPSRVPGLFEVVFIFIFLKSIQAYHEVTATVFAQRSTETSAGGPLVFMVEI